ncbi:MAG: hypothetical protein AAF404_10095 [Pseudomonadota bacterium]
MPKPSYGAQPEFSRNEHSEKTRRITRDLTSLQREIRVDFDQRINDLANILQRFKALMVTDIKHLNSANDSDQVPTLTVRVDDSTIADDDLSQTRSDEPTTPAIKSDPLAGYRETARFEAGLYQLNCQLYRFRLELDQELEFREEPLHQYFRGDSELADVLKRITEKTGQENNTDS